MAHYSLHWRRGSQIQNRHRSSGDSYIGANLQTPPTRTSQETLQNTLQASVSELGNSWSSTSSTDPWTDDDQTNIVRGQGSRPEPARAPRCYLLAPNSPWGGGGGMASQDDLQSQFPGIFSGLGTLGEEYHIQLTLYIQ